MALVRSYIDLYFMPPLASMTDLNTYWNIVENKNYFSCPPLNCLNVLRHCVTGEGYDADCTVSVSPLLYTVAKATIPGIYIRFMAVSSAKVSRSMSLL